MVKTLKIIAYLLGMIWFAYQAKISENTYQKITLWFMFGGMLFLIITTYYDIPPRWWEKK